MLDWNPNKPFGYLETVGRSSLRAASSFLRNCPDLQQAIARRLGDADAKAQLTRGLLEVGPSERRIGLLLAICANAPLVVFITSPMLHRLIYREDEELIRGLTLRVLSNAAVSDEFREVLHRTCAAVLEREYRIPESVANDQLAKHWLDSLCDIAKSVEDEISSYARGVRQRDDQEEQISPASLRDLLHRTADPALKIRLVRELVRQGGNTDLEGTNQLLATLVSDESQVTYVRDVAYQALYVINKLPVEDWPEVRRAQGVFLFPEDVDWSLVRKYLGASRRMVQ